MDKDRVEGAAEQAKGKVKEVAGEFPMTSATDFSRATSGSVENVQDDLKSLKDDLKTLKNDVGRLTQQAVGFVSEKGNEAIRQAKKNIGENAQEAAEAVREVRDTFADAIEESVRERPYTMLAIAIGLGFIIGAAWRR
jgi:ElaB/YqjD/DUF883 family membrane-anchored ribosome-binding protein